ncbi:MAG: hypothetical protein IJD28_01745 [Deferribacterales bacterium]|nr:hypothetical protein [Deferribacterales bacterium]
MFAKKRVIFILLGIFICGFISGAALSPVIVYKSAGNPYSRANLSERVFNVSYLEEVDLTDEQREEVEEIIEEYVDKYRTARESFSNARNFIYSEFNTALKEILTPEQYEYYHIKSENEFEKRRKYRSKMEEEVLNETK